MANKKNYSKQSKNQASDKIIEDANNIAKGIQKPGQTKEQTKLIAQGIQKGIEQYKKQHKGKARELDKRLKKVKNPTDDNLTMSDAAEPSKPAGKLARLLPWALLVLSWGGFVVYLTRIA